MDADPNPGALAVAERFFAALARKDLAAVEAIYAPDARIWHAHTGREQSAAQNLRVLAWVATNVAELRYEEIRRLPTPTGFVQQHVLRGIAPGGAPLEVPACLVVTVEDGRIVRLEEYLDSAKVAPLLPGPRA